MPVSTTPPIRLRSLDGLRGFAAAVVLAHHLSMTIPAVSDGYDSGANVSPLSPVWWAVESPLKIFLAGPEFVLVFFVLSGFVLTLSPLGKRTADAAGPAPTRRYDWAAYYPRRIIRLVVPVVASMVLAVVVITTLPHPVSASSGSWLARQAAPNTGISNLLSETLLIVDPNRPSVNSALWSLTWELWFSLLLPAAVVIALWSRRAPAVWAALFCCVSIYGYVAGVQAAMYLPAFALGALLGVNAARITAAVERWQRRRGFTLIWAALAVTGPMLCISYWLLRPLVHGPLVGLTMSMRVPGALLMVATIAFWPAAARVFERKPLAWLGKISFSLYLVHSPIVIAFGLIFSGPAWWIGATLSVVTSFGLALVMYALVEKPSRGLAARAGSRISDAVTSARTPLAAAFELTSDERAQRLRAQGKHAPGIGAQGKDTQGIGAQGIESAALERMPAIR